MRNKGAVHVDEYEAKLFDFKNISVKCDFNAEIFPI